MCVEARQNLPYHVKSLIQPLHTECVRWIIAFRSRSLSLLCGRFKKEDPTSACSPALSGVAPSLSYPEFFMPWAIPLTDTIKASSRVIICSFAMSLVVASFAVPFLKRFMISAWSTLRGSTYGFRTFMLTCENSCVCNILLNGTHTFVF